MSTVLITGASRGIGRACAEIFAENGYDVVINYNHSEREALTLAEKLHCRALRADVADTDAVNAMVKAIGDVDILIANAGISMNKMFCDMTPNDWKRVFDVDFGGVVNCVRACYDGMVHNKYGRIIAVTSMWGITGASCESAYSAAKAAVIGLIKSLAKELGPSGITANCIAPGVIDTDMNKDLTLDTLRELASETPLERLGSAREVAQSALYLARADFVTGQVLGVNGGFLI